MAKRRILKTVIEVSFFFAGKRKKYTQILCHYRTLAKEENRPGGGGGPGFGAEQEKFPCKDGTNGGGRFGGRPERRFRSGFPVDNTGYGSRSSRVDAELGTDDNSGVASVNDFGARCVTVFHSGSSSIRKYFPRSGKTRVEASYGAQVVRGNARYCPSSGEGQRSVVQWSRRGSTIRIG